jgi:hypothetical protein
LVHLVANGDCLMATTIARQIKRDYPGCHLTRAIGYKCRQVIDNNPDVDAVWNVVYRPEESPLSWTVWNRVKAEAEARKAAGEFDRIFFTQVFPDNKCRFDGTTRSSTFRNYPAPITVPVPPVVRLREDELQRARTFAERLAPFRRVILFECAPASGQSNLNQEKGLAVAQNVVAKFSDTAVVISTHLPFQSPAPGRIFDGSQVSFRENAELSKFCTLFVGCSSGITWLLTSDAARPLPMVLFLNPRVLGASFASVAYDFEHWGLPTGQIIENDSGDVETMTSIVLAALDDFGQARQRYHRRFHPGFWDFLLFLEYHSAAQVLRIFGTCARFRRRNAYGWSDYADVGRLARVLRVQGALLCDGLRAFVRARIRRLCGHR